MERRLAAILAADAVGYSRLMEADEERTHGAFRVCHDVIARVIAKHHGRIFGGTGDSVMAEFASPVEAVRAAIEIQEDLAERSLDLPEGHRMQFRIGINLGDVMVDGDELFGDGVNVAARLQALADPGGIYISGSVHEHAEKKLRLAFEDLGDCEVKNITKPVHVFRTQLRAFPAATKSAALATPAKPSIAVLPFTNMSDDPEHRSTGSAMKKPRTQYAKSGGISIAYQVFGTGPLDLVYVPGWVSHLEYTWEEPSYARFLVRLASFARVIMFDKRGTGMSDRDVGYPTLEQRMDDVRAVMAAVDSERAAILGTSEGGNMSVLFAATYPERTAALVAFSIFAKRVWSPDYRWAPTPEERQKWLDQIESGWGGTVDLAILAPSRAGDPAFAEWWSTYLRMGASPSAALALGRTNTEIDIRAILPAINVPTLVLHRRGDGDSKFAEGEYIAQRIPNARFVPLEGSDHLIWTEDQDTVLDEIEEFLTGGVRRGRDVDRILTTILFTDIVESTKRAAELGDQRWRDLLAQHHLLVRGELMRYRGREINTAGDGFLASFDGPARAIRCALAIRDGAAAGLGLQLRAGVHTGECVAEGDTLSGLALHISARVAAEAGPREVLVSSTVKDLVAGAGLAFADRGARVLKGVPGEWRLYAVTRRQ